MKDHIELVRPDFAVVTAIGEEHLENLVDIETVANEELSLLDWTKEDGGTVAVGLDDPEIRSRADRWTTPQTIRYSLHHKKSDVELQGTYQPKSSSLLIQQSGKPAWTLHCPLPGEHNANNLLAAVSIAIRAGLSPEEIQTGLRSFKGAWGRSEVHHFKNPEVTIINDAYNANPTSVEAALSLLDETAIRAAIPSHRKLVFLGDMLELGANEEKYHRDLANLIEQRKIDRLVLCGKRMLWLFDELKTRKLDLGAQYFPDSNECAKSYASDLQSGDFVLIKGSRGMKMENVFNALVDRTSFKS